ncbi:MAG TPA: hypothetical protein VNB06_10205 [Thermoanaerobaculia bacterium]|nr:hypothetical protein [Thermoanaerobaculia bacterium]
MAVKVEMDGLTNRRVAWTEQGFAYVQSLGSPLQFQRDESRDINGPIEARPFTREMADTHPDGFYVQVWRRDGQTDLVRVKRITGEDGEPTRLEDAEGRRYRRREGSGSGVVEVS